MKEFFILHFWVTVSGIIKLPINLCQIHLKSIYERTENPKKESPVLESDFQRALEFYVEAKKTFPDL